MVTPHDVFICSFLKHFVTYVDLNVCKIYGKKTTFTMSMICVKARPQQQPKHCIGVAAGI